MAVVMVIASTMAIASTVVMAIASTVVMVFDGKNYFDMIHKIPEMEIRKEMVIGSCSLLYFQYRYFPQATFSDNSFPFVELARNRVLISHYYFEYFVTFLKILKFFYVNIIFDEKLSVANTKCTYRFVFFCFLLFKKKTSLDDWRNKSCWWV